MTAGSKRITIEEAQLKTFSIDARALMINKRQMTLAVFRQLFDEEMYNWETIERRGEFWGIVNYHWKGECPDEEHYHVVWQNGYELRRCTITYRDMYSHEKEYKGRLHRGLHFLHNTEAKSVDELTNDQRQELEGIFYLWKQHAHGGPYGIHGQGSGKKIPDVLAALEREYGDIHSIKQQYDEAVRLRQRWAEEWKKICALDQLFIAV